MTMWRKTRTEMAGAMRSLQYDLGRREPSPENPVVDPDGIGVPKAAPVHHRAPDGPEVTSTGMSTFGGAAEAARPGDDQGPRRRPSRRIAAVTAFAALTVAGAAGSYFAVVNGLGGLLGEKPATAEPYPLAIGEQAKDQMAANAGMGRGSAAEPVAATPATTVVPAATPAPGVPLAPLAQPAPRTVTVTKVVTAPQAPGPTSEGCGDCNTPPVPTPTSAPSTTPAPAESSSPSPSPTETSASPAPTESSSSAPASAAGRRAHRRH